MTRPVALHPGERLAALVQQPGGLSREEAVGAVALRLSAVRDGMLVQIDATVAAMAALGLRLRHGPDRAALDELYVQSNALFGVAGLFGLAGLGQVAHSLCDLIEHLRASGAWHPAAVQVHLDGLVLARNAGSAEAAAASTGGLRRVVGSLVQGGGGRASP